MINNIGIGDARNILTSTSAAGKGLSIKTGTILKAEVMDIAKDGNALLRIISAGTSKEAMQETVIKAFTEVPLTKGQKIYLEVLGGKDNIKMQFIGDMENSPAPLQKNIPVKILDMLAKLSEARLSSSEFKDLMNMLKSLPESVKTVIPEFKGLEKLLLDAKQLNDNVLRAFVENSGVAFETKLKVAVLNDPKSVLRNLMALQSEGDLKGLLLKLKTLLKDQNIIQTLTQAGFKTSELSNIAEKFIRNIEFFQLNSQVNDMFCTFMPVFWEGLKDCEFLFKKNQDEGRDSCTCDINLELERLGKLSVSVTEMDKAFYVTFSIERPDVADLISSNKEILAQRFEAQGLLLKSINVNKKKVVEFGKTQNQGVNLKI